MYVKILSTYLQGIGGRAIITMYECERVKQLKLYSIICPKSSIYDFSGVSPFSESKVWFEIQFYSNMLHYQGVTVNFAFEKLCKYPDE